MELGADVAAVVTGAASGLGEATARLLAEHGARVAIFDLQEEKGERIARELGGVFCRVDVTNEESVAAGFARARDAQPPAEDVTRPLGLTRGERFRAHPEDGSDRDAGLSDLAGLQGFLPSCRCTQLPHLPCRNDRSLQLRSRI